MEDKTGHPAPFLPPKASAVSPCVLILGMVPEKLSAASVPLSVPFVVNHEPSPLGDLRSIYASFAVLKLAACLSPSRDFRIPLSLAHVTPLR